MAIPNDYPGERYYRSLLEALTSDWAWQPQSSSPSIDTAASAAADGSVGEVFLRHLYTDATLSITVPHREDGYAARLLLDHPLDERLPNSDGGFIGKLRQSQAEIVEGYETEYLDPIADTSLICRARIPTTYSQELVYTTILAISASALRIQRLHDEVETPVANVLAHR